MFALQTHVRQVWCWNGFKKCSKEALVSHVEIVTEFKPFSEFVSTDPWKQCLDVRILQEVMGSHLNKTVWRVDLWNFSNPPHFGMLSVINHLQTWPTAKVNRYSLARPPCRTLLIIAKRPWAALACSKWLWILHWSRTRSSSREEGISARFSDVEDIYWKQFNEIMFPHVWDSSPRWTINAFAPTESSKKTTFFSWGFSELRLLQTTFFVNVYTCKTNNLFTIPRTFAIFSNAILVSLVEIAIKCWKINVFA